MSYENNDQQTDSNHITNDNRRQFPGVLGAGAVAGVGLSQPASAQEMPVVKMGNNYFEYDYYCIPHKTFGMVGRIVVDTNKAEAVVETGRLNAYGSSLVRSMI